MTSSEQWLRVDVEFNPDVQRRDLEQVAETLREELVDPDLRVTASTAPETMDPSVVGPVLLLAASTSLPLAQAARQLAPKLLGVLGRWLAKDRRRQVKLRIGNRQLEVTDASAEEQQQLVTAFIAAIESDTRSGQA